MMKQPEIVKIEELLKEAALRLTVVLDSIPGIKARLIHVDPAAEAGPTLTVRLSQHPRHDVVGHVQMNGQPSPVRETAWQLSVGRKRNTTPILIAPYLSEESREICRRYKVGYLDLEGNCEIAFDNVYIQRSVATKPRAEERSIKSPFRGKSERIVRELLRDPVQRWRISELAKSADVSVGHVFNVKKFFVEREWAAATPDGLVVSNPNKLLDTWAQQYERPVKAPAVFVTPLAPDQLQHATETAMRVNAEDPKAVLSSFSAAQWLMPHPPRTDDLHFYADEVGFESLQQSLELSPIGRGRHVHVAIVSSELESLIGPPARPAPHIFCTGVIQTYLDLTREGEKGKELADLFRREKLAWINHEKKDG